MAIFGAAFQIGSSALAAYQAAITITGQNIANVGNSDYTRLTGRLEAMYGGRTTGGISPGTGVNLTALERHIDEAVEGRLRLALAARSGSQTTYQTLNRVESLYNELTDGDLSSLLSEFFSSLSNLQTDPTDTSARSLVISGADAVIRTLQQQRHGLLDQVEDLNHSAEAMTVTANGLVSEVAKLNSMIVTAEGRAQGASAALQDRRDNLLRQLAEMMDIQTRAQDNGVVNVYVNSEPIVDFNHARTLKIETVLEDGLERATVRFADNGGSVVMRSGQLAAIVQARDVHLAGQLDKLDELASALIYEVNRVHSSGRGLVGYASLTGTYTVRDADAVLNTTQAGLPFPVTNGTFVVNIRDKTTGQTTSQLIEVDLDGLGGSDTTLRSLAQALDNIPGVDASVTGDNRLKLGAESGSELSFSEDSSGVLAALGLATFFTGTTAATLDVNGAVRSDPRLLAASLDGASGDGTNAGRLAAVGTAASTLLSASSILDFHQNIINGLAVDTASALSSQEAADTVYSSLLAQREATSGVSLDEETINLTKYERAFQGASRFLNVVDSLSDEILSLVG